MHPRMIGIIVLLLAGGAGCAGMPYQRCDEMETAEQVSDCRAEVDRLAQQQAAFSAQQAAAASQAAAAINSIPVPPPPPPPMFH